VRYLASRRLLAGCVRDACWLISGSLLFAVALVLLRMLITVVYVVEYVKEYVVEYFEVYLASCWLLSCCFLAASWLLYECLLFAVAVVLIRMVVAVVYVVENVAEYGVESFVGCSTR
jgi:hypothetical protein